MLTDDKLQYNLIKSLKSHGWSRGNNLKYILGINNNKLIDKRWEFLIPGYNLRTTDINSSIGIEQLKRFKSFLIKRVEICNLRIEKIKNENVKIIGADNSTNNSWMGFPILLKDYKTKIKLEKILTKYGYDFRPIIAGNVKQHPLNIFFSKKNKIKLANCDDLMERGLVLPVHPFISKKQNKQLISIINDL